MWSGVRFVTPHNPMEGVVEVVPAWCRGWFPRDISLLLGTFVQVAINTMLSVSFAESEWLQTGGRRWITSVQNPLRHRIRSGQVHEPKYNRLIFCF